MRFAFDRTDLLTGSAGISDKELTALTTKLIAEGEPSDKVERTIAEQAQKMERYIHLYELEEDHWKELLRKLVLKEVYPRLSPIPKKQQDGYDEAMDEMKAILAGRFAKTLPLLSPEPADIGNNGRGKWGSRKRLTTR
jgi:hypothetical protein